MLAAKSNFLRCCSLFAILAVAVTAQAQAPIEPADLPARTIFYLVWRGAPAPAVRQANSLYALWDDPGFAPLRSALAGELSKDSNDDSKEGARRTAGKSGAAAPASKAPANKKKFTQQELAEFASLLDNGLVLGYIGEPEGRAGSGPAAGKSAHTWSGIFLIFNQSGKEALVAKLLLEARKDDPDDPPQLNPLNIAGVSALEIKRKASTTYISQSGKFVVIAGERPVFDETLKRLLEKSPAAPGTSLGSNAAFREARAALPANGILDFFVRVPNLADWPANSTPSTPGFNSKALMQALRLDAIHSLCGTVVLDGPRTRFQGALLGDTSAGTLFDIWAPGPVSPALASVVPAESVSFSQTQFDFAAIVELVRRTAKAVLPPAQTGFVEMAQAGIEERLGMPLDEAIGLFTGEFASFQTGADYDPARQIFALGIRKKPETLKILRTVLSERISSERNEGDVTLLKISLSGSQGNAGTTQWDFYHLGVTPDAIFGTSHLETLRTVLAQRSSGGAGLSASPKFQESRAHFPPQLNGFAFADFQRVNWEAVKEHWLAEAHKADAARKRPAGATGKTDSSVPSWLEQWNPGVLGRHLHTSASSSWKDSKGLHFDGWID